MENYVIAIPSYRRADKQETLEYLTGMGVPRDRIYVFVQTEADAAAYAKAHSDRANIVYRPADNVAQTRNNILRHFGGVANLLMVDDDISAFSRLKWSEEHGRKRLEKITDRKTLAGIFNSCFGFARSQGAEMFGLYPVDNEGFMSQTISTAVTVNTVIGFTRGSSLRFDASYATKEDIELCARVLSRGGKVLRYNFLCFYAKHRTNKGGCYEIWHSDANKAAARALVQRYPTILAQHGRKAEEVRVVAKDSKIPRQRKTQ